MCKNIFADDRNGDRNSSAYLATKLVNEEVFKSTANKFITQEFTFKETQVASSKIDSKDTGPLSWL